MAARGAGSPTGLRDWLDRLDTAVDSALNRTFDPLKPVSATDTTKRAGRFALRRAATGGRAAARASRKLRRLERRGLQYVMAVRAARKGIPPVSKVVAHPRLIIASCLIITLLLSLPAVFIFGAPSLGIKSGMRADLQAFLPPDDPSTTTLKEIGGNYSTDLLIALFDLYVPGDNITSVQWMKEISGFEGDMEFVNTTGDPLGVDFRLDDVGLIDGVNWTLSVPTLVKTYNVSTSNIEHALSKLTGFPPERFIKNATYAVPNDQASIDTVVDQMDPAQRRSLIANRENSSTAPYNRMVVLFGLTSDLAQQDAAIHRAQVIAKALNEKNGGNLVARISGPVVVFRDLQQGVSRELGNALPFIILGLVAVLYYWHRQWKVIVLTLVPVILASGIAYGVVGLAHAAAGPDIVVLAPQVVLAAPMLLAIGVSYGLYIANRYVEEPPGDSRKRIVNAVVSINPAIFLSAVATGIGFFALMIGTLPPIWTLGLALTAGIAVTYIFVYALLPAFIVLGDYKKKVSYKSWKRVSGFPEKHRIAIVLVAFSFVFASLGVLAAGKISFDVDYLTLTPAGTPSVEAMRDYSATMGGGQLGVVLAKGNFQQVAALDELDAVQESMGGIENIQSISIVTIMKLVRSPSNVTIGGQTIQLPVTTSFWELLHSVGATGQTDLLSIFYYSIPIELRSMLVDAKIQSSVIYVIMPFLPVDATRTAVNAVNAAVDNAHAAPAHVTMRHMAGVQTVTLAVNDLIIRGQIISLVVALFLTFVHIWLVFGSFKVALLTMVPVSVVSTLEPLILVLLNVPLSTVTVMIGSIAIGTGVDFAVQLTQRMRLEGYTQTSVNRAVENAGVSFVEATSTMVAGFAGMLAMNINSIQQFVLMIISLLVLNMIMAMFLYPALASIWIRRRRAVPPPEGLYTRAINYVKREFIFKDKPPAATRSVDALE